MKSISNEVEIELDGQTFSLKPTLKAARIVSRLTGGIQSAYGRIAASDIDTFCTIIKSGISTNKISDADLDEMVWRTGLDTLMTPVARFVRLLETGGRDESNDAKGTEGNGHS